MDDALGPDFEALSSLHEQLLNSNEDCLLSSLVYGKDAKFSDFDEHDNAYLVDSNGKLIPAAVFGTLCGRSGGTAMGASGTFQPQSHRDTISDDTEVSWRFVLKFPEEAHMHPLARMYVKQARAMDDLMWDHFFEVKETMEESSESTEPVSVRFPFNGIRRDAYQTDSGYMYSFQMETGDIYRVPESAEDKGLHRPGKVGELYDPNTLPDHKGSLFKQNRARLVQLNMMNIESKLVKPWNMHWAFRPGTIAVGEVLVTCSRTRKANGEVYLEYNTPVRKMKIFAESQEHAENIIVPSLPDEEIVVYHEL